MGVGRERDELLCLADGASRIGGVEFDAVDSQRLAAAPVEVEAPVIVHEQVRVDRLGQAGRQLRAAEFLERTQRRWGRVDGRRTGHQEEPVALPHHGRRVANVADVERVMLPRRAHVGADPGHVHGRVEDPPPVVPDGRRVRQFPVLLDAIDEPQERPVGLVPGSQVPHETADGVVRDRQRVAVGPGRVGRRGSLSWCRRDERRGGHETQRE